MKYKKLGDTQIMIPAVGQGTTGIGSFSSATQSDIKKKINVIKSGIDIGMSLLDTSDNYEGGFGEYLTSKVIRDCRHDVFLCTKFEPINNSSDGIKKSIERSLKALGTDYIDLYQVHWPNPTIPISETMHALNDLIDQGKILYAGVCNYSLDDIKEASKIMSPERFVSIQAEYNLKNRSIEKDLIPYVNSHKKTLFAYSVFNQGNFNSSASELLNRIADKYFVTAAQIVIAWVISNQVVSVIIRSNSMKHTLDNAAASDVNLSTDDINSINDAFLFNIVFVPTTVIEIANYDVDETHIIYSTLEEALKNKENIKPSPQDLANEFLGGRDPLPVELERISNSNRIKYRLTHGRFRYWGWVIAFSGERNIPAIIIN